MASIVAEIQGRSSLLMASTIEKGFRKGRRNEPHTFLSKGLGLIDLVL